jgi:hypothetical protein
MTLLERYFVVEEVSGKGILYPHLLFVLAADLLQSIINKAKDMGSLKLPLNVRYTTDFPFIQYEDDTLLIMEACPLQLFTLKSLLNTFADSTRLRVNYYKSCLYAPSTYLRKDWSIL